MSDSIATENYKKNIQTYLKIWTAEADAVTKELKRIKEELDKLDSTVPAEKKRIEELNKERNSLGDRMKKASDELRLNIIIISAAPEAPEKELVKIPPWLSEIIKAKGIPLGKYGMSIAPTVDFDVKSKKLKSFGIKIKW